MRAAAQKSNSAINPGHDAAQPAHTPPESGRKALLYPHGTRQRAVAKLIDQPQRYEEGRDIFDNSADDQEGERGLRRARAASGQTQPAHRPP